MEVGYAEFLMVVTVALAAFVSFMFHFRFTRVLTSLAICIAIAAISTPADPASCLFSASCCQRHTRSADSSARKACQTLVNDIASRIIAHAVPYSTQIV